jgi:hypothetical protein
LRTMAYKHLSLETVIERSSLIGNIIKDTHLCKNISVGLWISLNLILVDFPEISSQNSTLLKFFMALDSGRLELEKSNSLLNRE